jgi:hypothetical protein
MPSLRTIGRQGLSVFFHVMTPKKAHWYSIIKTNDNMVLDGHHQVASTSLSSLTNIDEDMHLAVHTCGLLYFRGGAGYLPMMSG